MKVLKQTSLLLSSLTCVSGCKTIPRVNEIGKLLFDKFIKDKSHDVVRDYIGGAIRLGFHDAGTFDPALNTNNGTRITGPTGCIPMTDEANFGLDTFLDSIDDIFQANKADCSRADFFYLTGAVAIDAAIENAKFGSEANAEFKPYEIGGSSALDTFVWGRDTQDQNECEVTKLDLLPKHPLGMEHIQEVFNVRMGFSNREITALMGSHSIGTCHRENSGFDLTWDITDTALDNEYYKNILDTSMEWARANVTFEKHQLGPKSRNHWLSLKEDRQHNMLNTDMALVWDFGTNNAKSDSSTSREFCQIGLGESRAQVASDSWSAWAGKSKGRKTAYGFSSLICPSVQGPRVSQRNLRAQKKKKKSKKKSSKSNQNTHKQCQKSYNRDAMKTSEVVEEYAKNAEGQSQFQEDFIAAWNKMAALGYKVGNKSESRRLLSDRRQLKKKKKHTKKSKKKHSKKSKKKHSKKSKKKHHHSSKESEEATSGDGFGIMAGSVTLQCPCANADDDVCLMKNNPQYRAL